MIISNKIEMKINRGNIDHYLCYYNKISLGDIILINSNELKRYSRVKILYECDVCKNKFKTSYKNYFTSINRKSSIKDLEGLSLCKKCTYTKSRQTILNKYGVESYTNTKEYSIKSGYNFLFIIDKDYTEFLKIINNNEKENI
jgi:hypothetical protein